MAGLCRTRVPTGAGGSPRESPIPALSPHRGRSSKDTGHLRTFRVDGGPLLRTTDRPLTEGPSLVSVHRDPLFPNLRRLTRPDPRPQTPSITEKLQESLERDQRADCQRGTCRREFTPGGNGVRVRPSDRTVCSLRLPRGTPHHGRKTRGFSTEGRPLGRSRGGRERTLAQRRSLQRTEPGVPRRSEYGASRATREVPVRPGKTAQVGFGSRPSRSRTPTRRVVGRQRPLVPTHGTGVDSDGCIDPHPGPERNRSSTG